LNGVGLEMLAMYGLRLKDEIKKRLIIQSFDFFTRPIIA
jgi:hypothetical protein